MRSELSLQLSARLARAGGFSLDAQLEVPPGVTVLYGASGAGKSTALSVIAGLVRPQAGHVALGGEVWFDSTSGTQVPVHRRGVALVFQSLALFPHLSAGANVEFGLLSLAPAERRRRAFEWLSRMRVDHVASRRPAQLSGGEAQRVALARALASGPRVLLLDEPFSALDRPLRSQLAMEIRAVVDELGMPTLWVTHDDRDAAEIADRAVHLSRGRVVAHGDPREVLTAATASG